MKKEFSDLKPEHQAMLRKLAEMPERAIDYSDIPATTEEEWRGAKRGADFRPVKRPVSIRLDADVLTYFRRRAETGGYQTMINEALREYMQRHPFTEPG